MSFWWVFESTYLADIFHDSESVVVININLPQGHFTIKTVLHFSPAFLREQKNT